MSGEVVLFEAKDGQVRLDVRVEHESVWLSLNQMVELFERDKSVISRHLRNVFASGELDRTATVAKNATVQREGDREVVRDIELFNLDAIISFGGEALYPTVQARGRRTSCTSRSRTTRSPTATSGSERCCFWSTFD